MNSDLCERIKALANEIGFVACGVTDTAPFDKFAGILDERIDQFPEARERYESLRRFVDPRKAAPWARSVVVCVRWYGRYRLPEESLGHIGRLYLCDDRFEDFPDHRLGARMKEGLIALGLRAEAANRFLPMRMAGARAGVCRIGRNCFAFTEEHGSWINLQAWVVDAELPYSTPSVESPCPETCRACINACPTSALMGPFLTRWTRCITYLTRAEPFPIEPSLWKRMGKWIYGCDVCQTACPLNKDKWKPLAEANWLKEIAPVLTPRALAEIDEAAFETFIKRRFPLNVPDRLERWRANARRAMEAE